MADLVSFRTCKRRSKDCVDRLPFANGWIVEKEREGLLNERPPGSSQPIKSHTSLGVKLAAK